MALTVAVTGEIGTSVVRALEVERLPFPPAEMEWVHTAHETLTAMVDAERNRAAR